MHLGVLFYAAVFLVLGREVKTVSCEAFLIGGLFPLSAKDPDLRLIDGLYSRRAAETAVEDVNSAGILSQYNITMRLEVEDSGDRIDTAVSAYVNFVQRWGLKSGGKIKCHY